jgi:hypothetical protein
MHFPPKAKKCADKKIRKISGCNLGIILKQTNNFNMLESRLFEFFTG